jgi:hypothetical protein
MPSRRSLRSHAFVALAAAGLASSVAAVAAIPGGDGTIAGCYKVGGHNPGVLRVVDAEAGQHCRSTETPISWNQTGPQGPPGQDFSFHRIVVVHGDGTPAQNGAALRNALSSHQGSDADNRVLIALEPGRYDTGSGALPLGPWTDLRGSGEADTTIVGQAPSNGTLLRHSTSLQIADVTIDAADTSQNAAVVIVSSGELDLRDARIDAGGTGQVAVQVVGTGTLAASGSTLSASGMNAFGHALDVAGANARATVEGGELVATDGAAALFVTSGQASLRSLTVDASGSSGVIVIAGGRATVEASQLHGDLSAIAVGNADSQVQVGASRIDGPVSAGPGASVACAASYDGSFAPLSASCS